MTLKLASDYDSFDEICARHGIEISATRVRSVDAPLRPRSAS